MDIILWNSGGNRFPPERECFMNSSGVRSCVPTMDVAMFEDLIDRLGEDLSRWPDDHRLAAERLLATSDAARTLHEEARVLRNALNGPPVSAPAGLADRIVAAAGESGEGGAERRSGA